ncbi:hypothetical protein CVS28_16895 [Arthrobacter glacialis]|nr:hypothetical protein CVS28_16895 [Arthrobacter glacialis]
MIADTKAHLKDDADNRHTDGTEGAAPTTHRELEPCINATMKVVKVWAPGILAHHLHGRIFCRIFLGRICCIQRDCDHRQTADVVKRLDFHVNLRHCAPFSSVRTIGAAVGSQPVVMVPEVEVVDSSCELV